LVLLSKKLINVDFGVKILAEVSEQIYGFFWNLIDYILKVF
jgi:hypothetical protein